MRFIKGITGNNGDKNGISKKIGGVNGKEIGSGVWGMGSGEWIRRRREFPLRYPASSAVEILVGSCLSEFAVGGDCGEFSDFFYRRGRGGTQGKRLRVENEEGKNKNGGVE